MNATQRGDTGFVTSCNFSLVNHVNHLVLYTGITLAAVGSSLGARWPLKPRGVGRFDEA